MTDSATISTLRAALAESDAKATVAQAMATEAIAARAKAEAKVSDAEVQVAHMKLMIEKLQRELYGVKSERKQRLLDQFEFQLGEFEATATEDDLAAEQAAEQTTQVKGFNRRKPKRKTVPRASSARAGGCPAARDLPVLWFGQAVEDRRGYYRDPGGDPANVEGDFRRCARNSPVGIARRSASRRRRSIRRRGVGRDPTCWR